MRKKKSVNIKVISLVVLSLIIVLELGILILQNDNSNLHKSNTSFNKIVASELASKIVAICERVPYKPTCYDREIPKLMDKPNFLTMENSFEVTREVQNLDKTYQYCHVLGHELSAKEVRKDPNNWKDVVSKCPSGMCSNGCIHGGFQEKFRKEKLDPDEIDKIIPDLNVICEERPNWKPTGMEQASCYHALGHLTMYVTGAIIEKSIELCDIVSIKGVRDYTQLCYDGVFMQIFQPLEPEDFALVKGKQPTKDGVYTFCNRYTGKVRGSCLTESWPLNKELLKSSEGIVKYCSQQIGVEVDRCYHAAFFLMAAQSNFDPERVKPICDKMPGLLREICFSDSASRFIETDYRNVKKSIELCTYAKKNDTYELCFNRLLLNSSFNFHFGSKEFYEMCNSLPEPWKEKCIKRDFKAGPEVQLYQHDNN